MKKKNRSQRKSLVPFAGLVLLVGVLCVCVSFFLFHIVSSRGTTTTTTTAKQQQQNGAHHHHRQGGSARHHPPQQQRLALLLPFIGSSPSDIPAYLELFCVGAIGISSVADVLLFHNGVLSTLQDNGSACATAPNIQLINLQSTHDMMELFATKLLDQVVDGAWTIPPQQFVPFLAKHTSYLPYTLVEYKPALGHILGDWIPTDTYSHWAYSDLDILWGDLGRHLTTADWTDFDIVTYSFGDQERLYLRGQFTMHRNDPQKINQLWRDCHYLSRIDERFARLVKQHQDFALESAEGCYSAAVLQYNDVSIKYATAAWTDIDRQVDTAYSHGIQLIRDVAKQRHLLVKRDITTGDAVTAPAAVVDQLSYYRLSTSVLYRDESLPWKEPIGAMQPIEFPTDSHHHDDDKSPDDPCRLYWIRPQYRRKLCLTGSVTVDPHESVYWVKGQLYKQETRDLSIHQGLLTGPFFHFQEWKRHYQAHQLIAVLDPSWSSFILTEDGGIPVQYNDPNMKIRKRQPQQLSSPLGLSLAQWNGLGLLADKDDEESPEFLSHRKNVLPRQTYCLRFREPERFHSIPCEDAVQWSNTQRIRLLTAATAWNQVHVDTEVTLCLTLQISSHESIAAWSKLLQQNVENWQGQPVVVVISLTEVLPDMAEQAVVQLQEALQSYAATAFVAAIMPQQKESDTEKEKEAKRNAISRKTLMNMATDMSPTRWYVSGLELERGLVLSRDSVVLALRATETSVQSGRMLWIPQFGLNDRVGDSLGMLSDPSSVSLKELVGAKVNKGLEMPWRFDSPCDDDSGHALTLADSLWWRLSEELLDTESKPQADSSITQRAKSTEEMNQQILKFLESSDLVLKSEESPILLVDNAGPYLGVRAHTFVRQVEAFAGLRCYNLLQMALLVAGVYQMDVLEGAFALSSPKTRQIESRPSRCDVCPVTQGHSKTRDALIQSEIHRVVNTAIVWENPQSTTS